MRFTCILVILHVSHRSNMPRFYRRRTGRRFVPSRVPTNRLRAFGGAGTVAPIARFRLRGFQRFNIVTAAWAANTANPAAPNGTLAAPAARFQVNSLDVTRWVIPGYNAVSAAYGQYRVLSATLLMRAYLKAYGASPIPGEVIEWIGYPTATNATAPTTLDTAASQPGAKYIDMQYGQYRVASTKFVMPIRLVEPRARYDSSTAAAFGNAPAEALYFAAIAAFLDPGAVGTGANAITIMFDAEIIWNIEAFDKKDSYN